MISHRLNAEEQRKEKSDLSLKRSVIGAGFYTHSIIIQKVLYRRSQG